MYFKDLSLYQYRGPSANDSLVTMNVGWLSKDKGYPKGMVNDEFLAKLKALCAKPVNLCRGWHTCEFCDPTDPATGNGEIRVVGVMGVTYAAPVMVAHYVEDHYYAPPDEFIRAVLAT